VPRSLGMHKLPAGWACIETTTPPSDRPRAQARTHNPRGALQYVLLAAE
jgi:hypothetical protein